MLIKLGKAQTRAARVCSPLFDLLVIKTDEENRALLLEWFNNPTEALKEEIMLCNLHLIRHTVGRYLSHWNETRRWEDDMVSVGVVALLSSLYKMERKHIIYFRPWVVCRIKDQIEQYLNNNRGSVIASLSTNYRRLRSGEPIASKSDIPLSSIGE